MAAVGTKSLRKILAQLLVDEVNSGADDAKFYIGVGKSDRYNQTDTIITPIANRNEETIARANLQSVKRVTECTTVIPRYNWSAGGIYSAWSDKTTTTNPQRPFYVVTETNDVYICLQQGKDDNGTIVTSTVKPSYVDAGVLESEAFQTSDGYRWKFLYSISSVRSFAYQSANWVPIQTVNWSAPGDSADLQTVALQQLAVQKAATPGQILGITLSNGGTNYTNPTITIKGNGINAAATATLSGGSIVKIEMNNESAALGSNYNYASVEITDPTGNGAVATPVIGPINGIGANAIDDLNGSSLMFTIKPDGDEGGAFLTSNDFRQITLWKNIEEVDSDATLSVSAGKALKYMVMKNSPEAELFQVDRLIRGVSSNAAAYIDAYDSVNIYYHQNEKTGFGNFVPGEIIDESDGVGRGPIDSSAGSALNYSIADAFSGECLYIENRAAVVRDNDQQEDIKIIITV